MRIRLAAVLSLALVVVGCSTPDGTASDPAPSTAPSAPAPVEPVAPTTPAAPATSAAAAPSEAGPTAAATPETCTVPNVVGLVHQQAQDTMQAAGLYLLREEDATGQGRLLVMDRNWRTTAQSVPAGQVVDCTTAITLSAKKIGE